MHDVSGLQLSQKKEVNERRWWIFAVVCLSLLAIDMDNTILNVALPTLARALGAGESQLQWFVDAYTLVFAGLLLTAGSLSDRYGRRLILMVGQLLFVAGSLWAALSGSANLLIAARAVMGLGAALIMPSTLSIIAAVFSGPERGRAIGAWSGLTGLGLIIGPVIGGWLLDHFAWGSIFLINLPVILVALVGALLIIPESRDPEQAHLDLLGVLLSIGGLGALVWGLIEAPTRGWGDWQILGALALALLLLLAFAVWEIHTSKPMLDVRLFRNPRFSVSSLTLTLFSFIAFGTLLLLTQYLQFVLGQTPLQAGVALMPLVPTLVIGSVVAPRLSERIGIKLPVSGGLFITAGGAALLTVVNWSSGYGLVALVLLVTGLGLGLAAAPAATAIMDALPVARAGVGSAVNDTTRQVGGALGIAVLGSVLSSFYRGALDGQDQINRLPLALADAVRDSIGKALLAAEQVPLPARGVLIETARRAFIEALNHSALVATAILIVGSLGALLFLPPWAASEPAPSVDLTPAGSPTTMEAREEEPTHDHS
ncbi:MFS transporter [Thermogemmatispora carboxidivorans]|uniref:MFS transporter n=1 Tax=Thermogemmatispora carboxidivorans TaxID=1382306 RepID=UPI000AF9EC51|nr:MFS transporter [Thermogemmatispora carboxidivorans]